MPGLFKPLSTLRAAGIGLTLLLSHVPLSQGALTLSTTRVVFDSDKRSASLIVNNPSNRAFAVQTWVNTAADDTTTAVPFMAAPALFRLDPGKEQQVQVNGLPNDLPQDRESLFYLNVQEIPQVSESDGNALNIALRTRIKFFYRPAAIKDNPMARLKDLTWSIERRAGQTLLVAHNPTPFHVSFVHIELSGAGKRERLNNPDMLAPMASHAYALTHTAVGPGLKVEYSAINDYGGQSTPLGRDVQITP